MEINKLFKEAAAQSRQLSSQSTENLLKLYSLFKQATEGDVLGERPTNPFDFVNISKYNAWEQLRGKSKEEAMMEYVDLVNSLK